jgi:hypothetical protein
MTRTFLITIFVIWHIILLDNKFKGLICTLIAIYLELIITTDKMQ